VEVVGDRGAYRNDALGMGFGFTPFSLVVAFVRGVVAGILLLFLFHGGWRCLYALLGMRRSSAWPEEVCLMLGVDSREVLDVPIIIPSL
jgi:hypothetical protein